ncbi:MAG: carboxypeptidase-like regulatory domain-containing protein [Lacunisphaera sp.]|nr:carboxypeptidase-like regulatory domain-containing protein [Lacunisphaera sp.]
MSNPIRLRMHSLRAVLLFVVSSLFVPLLPAASAADAGKGSITGSVSSRSTGNALQGALVQLPALKLSTLTDNAGHFEFTGVPAGETAVVAAYSGFEDGTAQVTVVAGATADAGLVLNSSDLVTLEKFTVSSVKEGQALATTEQRNGRNTKTVVALDEWGVLPTENVGELFTRLPGVSFTTDEDNLINNVTIRGMVSPNGQSFTRLNVDGMSATGVSGNGRAATRPRCTPSRPPATSSSRSSRRRRRTRRPTPSAARST